LTIYHFDPPEVLVLELLVTSAETHLYGMGYLFLDMDHRRETVFIAIIIWIFVVINIISLLLAG